MKRNQVPAIAGAITAIILGTTTFEPAVAAGATAPSHVSGYCEAYKKVRGHKKPRASCILKVEASPGYMLVPNGMSVSEEAKIGRATREHPNYTFGKKGSGIAEYVPVALTMQINVVNSRGMGRKAKYRVRVTIPQVKIPK